MSEQKPAPPVVPGFDPEVFTKNLARVMENGGKALSAYLKPRETGELKDQTASDLGQVVKTFHTVAEYWLSDPTRAIQLQQNLGKASLDLW